MIYVRYSIEGWFKKGVLSGVWLFSGDVHVVEGTLVEPGVVHSPWICGEVVFKDFVCCE